MTCLHIDKITLESNQVVCTECGIILKDCTLVLKQHLKVNLFVPYSHTDRLFKKLRDCLDAICTTFHIPSDSDLVWTRFVHYQELHGLGPTLTAKYLLATCLYMHLKQQRIPVSVELILDGFSLLRKSFLAALSRFQRCQPTQPPSHFIRLATAISPDSVYPLAGRANQFLELACKAWLDQGRTTLPLQIACMKLAYESRSGRPMPLLIYHRMFSQLVSPDTVACRYRELLSLCLGLCHSLPFLKDVTKKSLLPQLERLLSFSHLTAIDPVPPAFEKNEARRQCLSRVIDSVKNSDVEPDGLLEKLVAQLIKANYSDQDILSFHLKRGPGYLSAAGITVEESEI